MSEDSLGQLPPRARRCSAINMTATYNGDD